MITADRRKWWLLAAMGAILGVILLDETAVGVALPRIQIDLAMSEVGSHWVVNIYMLVLAGLAAAAGKLGDTIGHKVLMITGLAIFGLASVACGLAEGGAWLIAARGVQGVGAAIIFPSSLAMVTIAFPEEQRGLALGIYGAVGTVFLAVGPFVGGLLTDVASWRWIFGVNPVIVIGVALIVLATWTEPAKPGGERVDKTGFVLLVGGLSMLIYAIMEGPEQGWANPFIVSLLILGIVFSTAFVVVELRKKAPLIEVRLFTNPTFAGCCLVIFCAQFSKMAVFVFGALYLEDVVGMSPLLAGLALLPTVAPQPFTAPLSGAVADRYGARWPSLGGLLFLLAGFAWVTVASAWNDYAWIFPGLLIWGLSMAFLFVPPQRAVMTAVPSGQQGQAGGIAMSSQLVGATVGMAYCSTIFAMTNSYQMVFLANTVFTLLVLIVAWLTIDRRASGGAALALQAG